MAVSRLAWILLLAPSAFASAGPALPRNALPVPIIAQATSWSCGPAALLGVLYYWNVYDGTEKKLYAMMDTNHKDGTEPGKIAEVAQKFGLQAEFRHELTIADLKNALAEGTTPILDIQAWRSEKSTKPWRDNWDDGHYVVLVGLDRQFAYFMDPSAHAGYGFIPIPELLDRWHDYEDRHGYKEFNLQAAVLIHGAVARRAFPDSLIPIQ
ncbi:MAG: C39 family peptidase [Bdellovibrionota bacterium]